MDLDAFDADGVSYALCGGSCRGRATGRANHASRRENSRRRFTRGLATMKRIAGRGRDLVDIAKLEHDDEEA
jgi:hypothetical protein